MEQKQPLDNRDVHRIVEAYSDMLFRIAMNRSQNRSEAEDIVQNVYVRLMTARPSFSNETHERAWLIRTAINLCKDAGKAAARRANVPPDPEPATVYPPETADVLEAVGRLPEIDRYAVYLHYYEDVPVREIAKILREPEGTVSSRLSRARKKLRKLLKGDEYGTVSDRV